MTPGGLDYRARLRILVAFFASGSAGLIYQVVWARHFSRLVGSTAAGTATVLCAFMAGLGLGAWLAGRWLRRKPRRASEGLSAYAGLEVLIAVSGILLPFAALLLEPVFGLIYRGLGDSWYLFTLARFLLVGILLLIPTTAMGATLPVVVHGLKGGADRVGRSIGTLYALNTFGAVVGAFGAAFLLMPSLGMQTTILVAAFLNVIAATVAGMVAKELPDEAVAASEERAGFRFSNPEALVMGAGVAGMALQVGWMRYFALLIGSTVYSFATVSGLFIFGLAIGSWIGGRLADRFAGRMRIASWLLAACGVLGMIEVWLFNLVPIWMAEIAVGYPESRTIIQALLVGALILPSTILVGAVLPLCARDRADRPEDAGPAVARLYALNTVGAIAGAFIGTFIGLHLFGTRWTLLGAAGFYLMTGGHGLWHLRSSRFQDRLASLGLAMAVLFCAILLPNWDMHRLHAGVYLFGLLPGDTEARQKEVDRLMTRPDGALIYESEDHSAMVSVYRGQHGGISLKINGKTEASTLSDMVTQVLSAHIPLAVHPEAKDIMILGLGGGATVGAAMDHDVERIDVCELSPGVVEAAERFFKPLHKDYPNDDRVNLILNDGRNHLALANRQYDVIVSQPSNLWIAGMGELFTVEFFELCRQRLREGGVFATWVQAYSMDPELFKTILRTFVTVFPKGTCWEMQPGTDYLLVSGFDLPWEEFDVPPLERDSPTVAQRLAFDRNSDLLSFLMMDNRLIRDVAGSGPLNTDNNLHLEYRAPEGLGVDRRAELFSLIDADDNASWARVFDVPQERWPELARRSNAHRTCARGVVTRVTGDKAEGEQLIEVAAKTELDEPLTADWVSALTSGRIERLINQGELDEAGELTGRLLTAYPWNWSLLISQGRIEMERANLDAAQRVFERADLAAPWRPEPALYLAQVHFHLGQADQAEKWFRTATDRDPERADSWTLYARFLDVIGEPGRALEARRRAESVKE